MNMTIAPKNVDNVWIDNLIYCDGLKCTSDAQFSIQDIFDKDNATTGAWGVIRKITGVYYLTGSLVFGDNAGTLSSDFKDITQVVVFEDRKINAALYDISIVGNSTGTTKFQLGELSGTAGISGCNIRTQSFTQTPKFKITCTDAGLADARYQTKFYGCAIGDSGIVTLPLATTNREVLNCSFEKCGVIVVSTCKVENCNFISADDAGVRVTDTTDPPKFKNSNLISCPYGMRIPNIGTYKFDNLKFIGSFTAHIDNTSGGLVTVNCVNGANPTTYTGNTTINNYVDVTVTVKDESQAVIQGASVRVSKLDDNAVVYMNELTDVNGIATESINYPGAVSLRIRARKSSVNGTRYTPMETTGVMTAAGFALTVTLYADGNIG